MTEKQRCEGCGREAVLRHENLCIKCVSLVARQQDAESEATKKATSG